MFISLSCAKPRSSLHPTFDVKIKSILKKEKCQIKMEIPLSHYIVFNEIPY